MDIACLEPVSKPLELPTKCVYRPSDQTRTMENDTTIRIDKSTRKGLKLKVVENEYRSYNEYLKNEVLDE